MRTALLLPLLLICILPARAQKTLELEPFDALVVAGNMEVLLQSGDTERVVIEVFGAPQDEVSIKSLRGELRISFLNSLIYKNYEAKITVYYKTLRSVRGNAGARITATGPLQGDKIDLRAASGARVALALAVNALEAMASEGGILQLSGVTQTQKASAVTGGQYEAFDLESQSTYVRAHTGGQAQVVALRLLEATAHTGGAIEYRGNPEENNVRNIISGDIRKRSE